VFLTPETIDLRVISNIFKLRLVGKQVKAHLGCRLSAYLHTIDYV